MKKIIGIIGAMNVEIKSLVEHFDNPPKTEEVYGSVFSIGAINGNNVVVVKSGVGKVNAAFVATMLKEKFGASEIVMIGVAGGITAKPMDAVVASGFVQHDVKMYSLDHGFLDIVNTVFIPADQTLASKLCGNDASMGIIATGEAFAEAKDFAEIHKKFPDAVAVDMECGAVAQVCKRMDVPFAAVKVISDSGDGDQYLDFEAEASAKSVATVLRILS